MSRIATNDPMIARAAMANQAKAQQAAKIENVILAAATNIYGHLAAMELASMEEWNAAEIIPRLRLRALHAKEAALLLAEAYGMVQIKERPAGDVASDSDSSGEDPGS